MARILYFHVPMAIVAFLAFFVVFGASIAYLRTSNERWDHLGRASAEVGVIFTTLVLITGAIWGYPIWGTWWSWDPKLTGSQLVEPGDLFVEDVLPAPDCGHLLVHVVIPSDRPVREVLGALRRDAPSLRSEVAMAITRKRTPELSFVPALPSAGNE